MVSTAAGWMLGGGQWAWAAVTHHLYGWDISHVHIPVYTFSSHCTDGGRRLVHHIYPSYKYRFLISSLSPICQLAMVIYPLGVGHCAHLDSANIWVYQRWRVTTTINRPTDANATRCRADTRMGVVGDDKALHSVGRTSPWAGGRWRYQAAWRLQQRTGLTVEPLEHWRPHTLYDVEPLAFHNAIPASPFVLFLETSQCLHGYACGWFMPVQTTDVTVPFLFTMVPFRHADMLFWRVFVISVVTFKPSPLWIFWILFWILEFGRWDMDVRCARTRARAHKEGFSGNLSYSLWALFGTLTSCHSHHHVSLSSPRICQRIYHHLRKIILLLSLSLLINSLIPSCCLLSWLLFCFWYVFDVDAPGQAVSLLWTGDCNL